MPTTDSRRTKKRPGRKRRLFGVSLLTVAFAVAAAWAASGWWMTRYTGGPYYFHCLKGRVSFVYAVDPAVLPQSKGWNCGRMDAFVPAGGSLPLFEFSGYRWNGNQATPFSLTFPLWPLGLLLTAAGVPPLRSGIKARRRVEEGFCAECDYDRRATPRDAPCPECGKAPFLQRLMERLRSFGGRGARSLSPGCQA